MAENIVQTITPIAGGGTVVSSHIGPTTPSAPPTVASSGGGGGASPGGSDIVAYTFQGQPITRAEAEGIRTLTGEYYGPGDPRNIAQGAFRPWASGKQVARSLTSNIKGGGTDDLTEAIRLKQEELKKATPSQAERLNKLIAAAKEHRATTLQGGGLIQKPPAKEEKKAEPTSYVPKAFAATIEQPQSYYFTDAQIKQFEKEALEQDRIDAAASSVSIGGAQPQATASLIGDKNIGTSHRDRLQHAISLFDLGKANMGALELRDAIGRDVDGVSYYHDETVSGPAAAQAPGRGEEFGPAGVKWVEEFGPAGTQFITTTEEVPDTRPALLKQMDASSNAATQFLGAAVTGKFKPSGDRNLVVYDTGTIPTGGGGPGDIFTEKGDVGFSAAYSTGGVPATRQIAEDLDRAGAEYIANIDQKALEAWQAGNIGGSAILSTGSAGVQLGWFGLVSPAVKASFGASELFGIADVAASIERQKQAGEATPRQVALQERLLTTEAPSALGEVALSAGEGALLISGGTVAKVGEKIGGFTAPVITAASKVPFFGAPLRAAAGAGAYGTAVLGREVAPLVVQGAVGVASIWLGGQATNPKTGERYFAPAKGIASGALVFGVPIVLNKLISAGDEVMQAVKPELNPFSKEEFIPRQQAKVAEQLGYAKAGSTEAGTEKVKGLVEELKGKVKYAELTAPKLERWAAEDPFDVQGYAAQARQARLEGAAAQKQIDFLTKSTKVDYVPPKFDYTAPGFRWPWEPKVGSITPTPMMAGASGAQAQAGGQVVSAQVPMQLTSLGAPLALGTATAAKVSAPQTAVGTAKVTTVGQPTFIQERKTQAPERQAVTTSAITSQLSSLIAKNRLQQTERTQAREAQRAPQRTEAQSVFRTSLRQAQQTIGQTAQTTQTKTVGRLGTKTATRTLQRTRQRTELIIGPIPKIGQGKRRQRRFAAKRGGVAFGTRPRTLYADLANKFSSIQKYGKATNVSLMQHPEVWGYFERTQRVPTLEQVEGGGLYNSRPSRRFD